MNNAGYQLKLDPVLSDAWGPLQTGDFKTRQTWTLKNIFQAFLKVGNTD
jgi:hypothetical protein